MSRVISGATGHVLPCCWSDCERLGDDRHEARVRDGARTIHYVFCCHAHLMFWVNSHVKLNHLPSGDRGGRFL